MESNKLIIGITHGDINGIGYEIILKALSDSRISELFVPVIYGSSKVAGICRKSLDLQSLNLNVVNSIEQINSKRVNLINCVSEELKMEPGQSTLEAGKAALDALERATDDLRNGLIHAITTAPINKNNIQSDAFRFPGHTEYLEEKFGEAGSSLMMLVSDDLRVAVVTGHIPLCEVSARISQERIVKKLTILNHSLKRDFGIIRPRIAVLGINPHAGDGGVIGSEEQETIIPALKKAEQQGVMCFGPFPADGFFGSESYTKYDAVLAMYHDQGLIPFKNMAMERGVNFTAGLPIVRTSPDHGTAYDIAGKNIASETSLLQAFYVACDVLRNRSRYDDAHANPLQMAQKKEAKRNSIE